MQEEVQDVRSSGNYVAFIFNGTNGNGKYRIDIYNMNGTQVLSLPFAIEYRDVLISDQELIIYNEAECLIYNLNGKEKIQRTDTGTDAAFKKRWAETGFLRLLQTA